jgi:hypothetical protein
MHPPVSPPPALTTFARLHRKEQLDIQAQIMAILNDRDNMAMEAMGIDKVQGIEYNPARAWIGIEPMDIIGTVDYMYSGRNYFQLAMMIHTGGEDSDEKRIVNIGDIVDMHCVDTTPTDHPITHDIVPPLAKIPLERIDEQTEPPSSSRSVSRRIIPSGQDMADMDDHLPLVYPSMDIEDIDMHRDNRIDSGLNTDRREYYLQKINIQGEKEIVEDMMADQEIDKQINQQNKRSPPNIGKGGVHPQDALTAPSFDSSDSRYNSDYFYTLCPDLFTQHKPRADYNDGTVYLTDIPILNLAHPKIPKPYQF